MTPFGRYVALGATLLAALLLGVAISWSPPQPAHAPAPGIQAEPETPAWEPARPAPETRSIRVDGREVVVGARDRVTLEHQDTITEVGAGSRTDRQAHTVGVGLETSAAEVAQSFRAEQARTELDGVGAAAGGGFSYSGEMTGGVRLNAFHAIGAACLLAALGFVVVPLFLKMPPRWGTAAALAAGGVAFIAIGVSIDRMPWAWAVAGVLVLAGLGFWLFMAIRNGKAAAAVAGEAERERGTVEALVAMVSQLEAPSKAAAKAKLDEILRSWTPAERTAVERAIADAKARLGL